MQYQGRLLLLALLTLLMLTFKRGQQERQREGRAAPEAEASVQSGPGGLAPPAARTAARVSMKVPEWPRLSPSGAGCHAAGRRKLERTASTSFRTGNPVMWAQAPKLTKVPTLKKAPYKAQCQETFRVTKPCILRTKVKDKGMAKAKKGKGKG